MSAPPLTAPHPTGLTAAEVAERVAEGRVNRSPDGSSRSLWAIVRGNVFTRFNAILGTLLVVILTVGPYQDALFGIVLFTNMAIGITQELRAKRTLDRLTLLTAPVVVVARDGDRHEITVEEVVDGDIVELVQGTQIVADGTVVAADGLEVDESLLSGESVPLAKEPGTEVLSGSFVTAGQGWYRAERIGADSYANQVTAEARQFSLVRSELRRGTDRILGMVTWLILPTAVLLIISQLASNTSLPGAIRGTVAGVGSMIPEGLVLLTSIAFTAGVLRLARRNVLVQELAAIEGLARVDVVCTDKTGTITEPELEVTEVVPLDATAAGDAAPGDATTGGCALDGPALDGDRPARDGATPGNDGATPGAGAAGAPIHDIAAVLGALAAADPEPNASGQALAAAFDPPGWTTTWRAAFSSARRYSGAGFGEHGDWIMGAPNELLAAAGDSALTRRAAEIVDDQSRRGRRVLLVARTEGEPAPGTPPVGEPVALVAIEERVRANARATLDYFAAQDVTVKVMSGDDPRTVGAVAARVGIAHAEEPYDASDLPDDPEELADLVESTHVFGRVGPQQKQAMVRALQARGHTVSMTGDGVNDVLALKEADLGVAMGSGAAVSRSVAPVVLLDSDFAGLPPVLAEGRRVIANVERVANLFVTKTVYAALLALSVGVLHVPFPFLPRHLTIISSLTIGIPAFFLALAPNDRRAVPGFVGRVLRFAVPAGLLAAIATMSAYGIARSQSVPQIEARTTATITLFIVALWVLAILARPTDFWRLGLETGLAGAFVLALLVPWSRHFFALNVAPPEITTAAVGIAVAAAALLEVAWRVTGWMRPDGDTHASAPG